MLMPMSIRCWCWWWCSLWIVNWTSTVVNIIGQTHKDSPCGSWRVHSHDRWQHRFTVCPLKLDPEWPHDTICKKLWESLRWQTINKNSFPNRWSLLINITLETRWGKQQNQTTRLSKESQKALQKERYGDVVQPLQPPYHLLSLGGCIALFDHLGTEQWTCQTGEL